MRPTKTMYGIKKNNVILHPSSGMRYSWQFATQFSLQHRSLSTDYDKKYRRYYVKLNLKLQLKFKKLNKGLFGLLIEKWILRNRFNLGGGFNGRHICIAESMTYTDRLIRANKIVRGRTCFGTIDLIRLK